ncbi:hypothetical protein ES703_120458 [subsurface metagenome]
MSDMSDGLIIFCCSSGNVTGDTYVGGLVGNIAYSPYRRTIAYCYSTADVSGRYAAGLVSHVLQGEIFRCYSAGRVSGSYAAGLIYYCFPLAQGCFWDVESSGQPRSGGGTGKTTAEMQDPNTFIEAGWDFVGEPDGPSDIWAIPIGGGYPILWWQLSPLPELPFSAGTGELDNPYLISAASQLNGIGYNPRLMSSYFKLVDDIDLSGMDFFIIGTDPFFPFAGVFDGDGHTISGFTCDSTDEDKVGLFSRVDGEDANIRNLRLLDSKVDVPAGKHVGPLVGELERGTITNCHVEGGSVMADDYVGGLVGYQHTGTVISNCYSSSNISGTDHVGGLVGKNIRGTINNCYVEGSVSGNGEVGGLVGRNRDRTCFAVHRQSFNGAD